eukprot:gene6539-13233_t
MNLISGTSDLINSQQTQRAQKTAKEANPPKSHFPPTTLTIKINPFHLMKFLRASGNVPTKISVVISKEFAIGGFMNESLILTIHRTIGKRNLDLEALSINLGWHQSPESEDGMKYAHDEVTFRTRIGDSLQSFIPQAERYSTKDWWHNLKTMKSSRLLKRIRGVITANTLWSIVVCVVHSIFRFNSPGSKAHALLGSALGLLLVFRTNTAYNRFWEGRTIWERLLSSLRDMGRMTVVYSDAMSSTQLERIFHLLIAFPLVLQEYVQGFHQPTHLSGLMTEQEVHDIDRVTNRPYFVINRLAKEVRMIPDSPTFTSRERERMFKFVDDISRSIGQCERIVQTPVPLTYARHTSRFLALWCLTLPPCLVSEFRWYVVPFTAMVSWALFGIQEIGMMIEEPFQRALKLEVFANTIRRDLTELLHVTNINMYPLTITSPELKYEQPVYLKSAATTRAATLGNVRNATDISLTDNDILIFPA